MRVSSSRLSLELPVETLRWDLSLARPITSLDVLQSQPMTPCTEAIDLRATPAYPLPFLAPAWTFFFEAGASPLRSRLSKIHLQL
jgi:hypothetical protein